MKIMTQARTFFLKNWFPKLICLLVAMGLWSWVVVQQSAEQEFQVPVGFYDVPDNYIVSEQSDRSVTVALRGQRTFMGTIGSTDLGVEVNLSGIQSREKHIQILPWHVQHPPGVEVVDIRPRSIRVLLEMRMEKEVGVRAFFANEMVDEYEYEIEVSPDTAVVAGPRSSIETLNNIDLAELYLPEPQDSPLRTAVEAQLPPGTRLISPSENIFEVSVDVSEPEIRRVVSGVEIDILNIPGGQRATVEPRRLDVEISGPQGIIENLRPEDLRATVSAPQADDGPEIRVIRFDLPEEVSLVDPDAATRTAKVRLVD